MCRCGQDYIQTQQQAYIPSRDEPVAQQLSERGVPEDEHFLYTEASAHHNRIPCNGSNASDLHFIKSLLVQSDLKPKQTHHT